MRAHVPLHDRVQQLQRDKAERLQALRRRAREDEACTFQPHINHTSRQLVNMVSSETGADSESMTFERRQALHTRKAEVQNRDARVAAEKENTFKPRINKMSLDLIDKRAKEAKEAGADAQDFVARQQLHMQRTREKMAQLHTATNQPEATFHPQLTPTSTLLVASRQGETERQRLQRLAIGDKRKADEARQSAEDEYYNQFSFRPQINQISEVLAKSKQPQDLMRPIHQVSDELAHQLQKEFTQHCTFKPQVHSSRPNPSSSSTLSISAVSSAEYAAERSRKLAAARNERQYEELKPCTFQPKLTSYKKEHVGAPVAIAGIEQHRLRQERAAQMKKEKEEREKQAFEVKNSAKQKGAPQYTVPRPFKLHTTYHSSTRKERNQASLADREAADCTFRPHTNARVANEILHKYILRDDGEEAPEDFLWDDEDLDEDVSYGRPAAHSMGAPIRPAWTDDTSSASPPAHDDLGWRSGTGAGGSAYARSAMSSRTSAVSTSPTLQPQGYVQEQTWAAPRRSSLPVRPSVDGVEVRGRSPHER